VKNRSKLAFLGGVLQVEHQSQGLHLSPRQQPLHITHDLEQLLPHLRTAQVVHHLANTKLASVVAMSSSRGEIAGEGVKKGLVEMSTLKEEEDLAQTQAKGISTRHTNQSVTEKENACYVCLIFYYYRRSLKSRSFPVRLSVSSSSCRASKLAYKNRPCALSISSRTAVSNTGLRSILVKTDWNRETLGEDSRSCADGRNLHSHLPNNNNGGGRVVSRESVKSLSLSLSLSIYLSHSLSTIPVASGPPMSAAWSANPALLLTRTRRR